MTSDESTQAIFHNIPRLQANPHTPPPPPPPPPTPPPTPTRSSCHPIHVFLSLLYGEFLCPRRNSMDNSSYDQSAKIILIAFANILAFQVIITTQKMWDLSFITKPDNTSVVLTMRLKLELWWIYRLHTSLPHGQISMD